MSCSEFEVGSRVEAVTDFEIEEALARRDKWVHKIEIGDSGEILRKLALGKHHSMIVRWDKIPQSRLSIDGDLFENVKVSNSEAPA
ncbi:MAG: hypothetical protein FI737_10105 [SAR202 cluster bacterium]|jgi:hypothetical protein|nr:hypothetical protein [SAR202 cluster bacterium]